MRKEVKNVKTELVMQMIVGENSCLTSVSLRVYVIVNVLETESIIRIMIDLLVVWAQAFLCMWELKQDVLI